MATEWLDSTDYISELEDEIENLLLEVEGLTVKNKTLLNEIESLRERLEACNRYREAAVNNAVMFRKLMDEWERRAKLLRMDNSITEAEAWFEE